MTESTNDELRRKIAEVNGWIVQESPTELWYLDEIARWQIVPNWPVNIADAWELVEEMRESGYVFDLRARREQNIVMEGENYNHDRWSCECHPFGTITTKAILETADTAPRAICLAWLEWKLTCSANNVTTP